MDSRMFAVVVGLVALYAFLALLVSQLNELLAQALQLRSRTLVDALRTRLLDPALTDRLLSHPLVQSQGQGAGEAPGHLASGVFARALLALLRPPSSETASWQQLVEEAQLPAEVQERLLAVVGRADASVEEAERRVADWFDQSMAALSERYRSHARWWSFALGLGLAVVINADTWQLASRLWNDPVQRQAEVALVTALVARCQHGAAGAVDCSSPPSPGALPLGWSQADWSALGGTSLAWAIVAKVAGLGITSLAISLGAPFWFDLLRKVTPARARG